MAPKLPPPARTKAVVLGPAWLDKDKASVAPVIGALVKKPAPFGHIYSSEFAEDATNKILRRPCPGCCAAPLRRCAADQGPANPGPGHETLAESPRLAMAAIEGSRWQPVLS